MPLAFGKGIEQLARTINDASKKINGTTFPARVHVLFLKINF
jgi:hypothetical protein